MFSTEQVGLDLDEEMANTIRFNDDWKPLIGDKITSQSVKVDGADARRIEFRTSENGPTMRRVLYLVDHDERTYQICWETDEARAEESKHRLQEILDGLTWKPKK